MRIASLLSAGTEIVYGLGLGDQLVAVSHECDYPVEAATKPRVTRAELDSTQASSDIDREVRERVAVGLPLYTIDADLLASLRPELIITQAQCDVCAVRFADVLELVQARPELRRAQVVALNPRCLNDVFEDIARIGAAAGALSAADRWLAELRQRVASVKLSGSAAASARKARRTGASPQPPGSSPQLRVIMIEWIDPLMLAGNWMPELIELAGGRCDLTQADQHSEYADWNTVIDYDPDVVLVAPCGFDLPRTRQEAAALRKLPNWERLSAVKNRQVFLADGNAYFNRSGPRLVDSLEILSQVLHGSNESIAGVERL